MVKKAFGIRLTEELVESMAAERKRRIDAWGVPISLTAIVELLIKERLAQLKSQTSLPEV